MVLAMKKVLKPMKRYSQGAGGAGNAKPDNKPDWKRYPAVPPLDKHILSWCRAINLWSNQPLADGVDQQEAVTKIVFDAVVDARLRDDLILNLPVTVAKLVARVQELELPRGTRLRLEKRAQFENLKRGDAQGIRKFLRQYESKMRELESLGETFDSSQEGFTLLKKLNLASLQEEVVLGRAKTQVFEDIVEAVHNVFAMENSTADKQGRANLARYGDSYSQRKGGDSHYGDRYRDSYWGNEGKNGKGKPNWSQTAKGSGKPNWNQARKGNGKPNWNQKGGGKSPMKGKGGKGNGPRLYVKRYRDGQAYFVEVVPEPVQLPEETAWNPND